MRCMEQRGSGGEVYKSRGALLTSRPESLRMIGLLGV